MSQKANSINSRVFGNVNSLTANGVLVGAGTDTVITTNAPSSGNILFASTSSNVPKFGNFNSNNPNLSFTPNTNTLDVSLKIQPVFNTTVSGSAIPLVPGNSYLSNNTSVTQQYSLPSSPIVGDTYRICNAPVGSSSLGWTIIQSSGQQIVGIISGAQSNTTSGTSGHLDSAPTPGTNDSNVFVEIVYVGNYGGISTFQIQSCNSALYFV